MNPHIVVTATGIRIGERFMRPPPRDIGSEAERIQTALLIETQPGWWERLVRWIKGKI